MIRATEHFSCTGFPRSSTLQSVRETALLHIEQGTVPWVDIFLNLRPSGVGGGEFYKEYFSSLVKRDGSASLTKSLQHWAKSFFFGQGDNNIEILTAREMTLLILHNLGFGGFHGSPLEVHVVPHLCLDALCNAACRYRDAGLRSALDQQRSFAPAVHRQLGAFVRQSLHCLHHNNAGPPWPTVWGTVGDESEHGKKRSARR
jgi:hypothetical protein